MAFCITFGMQDFTSRLRGYEHVTAQCHNCGNWSGHVITRWPWFTVCFIPVLPLSFKKYKEINCHICHFSEDLRNRPDVLNQHPAANPGPVAAGAAPPQGWGGAPPQAQYK